MAQWVIPTFSDPFYTQTTTLDGVPFNLSFAYSSRERCWYLSLFDATGAPLAVGIKVLANSFLLGARTKEGLPKGELVAVTTSTDKSPPDREELGFGLRCELVYFDAAEMAEQT